MLESKCLVSPLESKGVKSQEAEESLDFSTAAPTVKTPDKTFKAVSMLNTGRIAGAQRLSLAQNIAHQYGNRQTLRMIGALRKPTPVQRSCACEQAEKAEIEEEGKNISATTQNVTIQRIIGDGHDLSSPRFKDDPKLEACFDDKDRLRVGDRGGAVEKVQQALLELGHDLGKTGVDGIYGNKTANAVKKFKADQSLGSTQFGDVGPGTMGRLDQLFPGPENEEPGPVADDEGDNESCPADDVIVTSLNSQASTSSAFAGSNLVTQAASHVDIKEAVKRFKQKVDMSNPGPAGRNVSNQGQFIWSMRMNDILVLQLNALGNDPDALKFKNTALEATTAIIKDPKAPKIDALLLQLGKIAAKTKSSSKPQMLSLLKNFRLAGGNLETLLWNALNNDPQDRADDQKISSFTSLTMFRKLMTFDKVNCGGHAFIVAQRLKKKGGIVARDKKISFPGAVLSTGSGFHDRRPIDAGTLTSTSEPSATAAVKNEGDTHLTHLGDFITQSGVASAVAKMQAALDAGQLIHARVLSGVGIGTNPNVPPIPNSKRTALGGFPEEHSLLIIGFDGNKFVFNDPDAGVSHAVGNGFGFLFHDTTDNRLSTAQNPGDMVVDAHGLHTNKNKRYQVITLTPI